MKRVIIYLFCLSAISSQAADFTYMPAPVDNPLKGVVPYVNQHSPDRFPHSMEFTYIPMRDLMDAKKGTGSKFQYTYDWTPIERKIKTANERGHQLIFRVHLEYPGQPIAVPQFLIDGGLKITEWTHSKENKTNYTPDYEDPRLRQAIKVFIAALGNKYDGDPRIGFITLGILGKWGEWHNFPRQELFAKPQAQQEVMDAYATAFTTTKILMRYPAGDNDSVYAPNADAPFGYHDDSFAWATLDTDKPGDSWFFMTRLKKAGPAALGKWKTCPIGGEIRPELWETIFTDSPHTKQQDFDRCVQKTNVTWLMDTGLSSPKYPLPKIRYDRAVRSIRKMGYEFHISNADIQRNNNQMVIRVHIENRGVAPFYYDWPVEVALLDSKNKPVHIWKMHWKLTQLLPNRLTVWKSNSLTVPVNVELDSHIGIRIPNPMPGGKPLRFANTYDSQNDWLRLE